MTNSFGLDREYDSLVSLYEKHVGKVTASLTSEDMVKALIPHWNEEAKTMDRASLKECITQFREYWREMTEGEDE